MTCKANVFAPVLMEKMRPHKGPIAPCCERCKEECPHAVKAEKLSDYGLNRTDLPDPPGYEELLKELD